jgi:hypothetical protein
MITLNEPNGVTNIGGAKEYAAKFATCEREHGYQGYGVKRVVNETHIRPTPLAATSERHVNGRKMRNPFHFTQTHLLSSLPTR